MVCSAYPPDFCSLAMSNSSQVRVRRGAPSLISGLKIQSCDECEFALVDLVMLVAVLGAFGCLLFPCARAVTLGCVGMAAVGYSLFKQEVSDAPALYGCVALGTVCATLGSLLIILVCAGTRCGNPECKALRKPPAFDIQVQTEEMLKSSNSNQGGGSFKEVVREGMVRFRREHVRELEARLRKMAPVNGKAVLIYRARCGCNAGRLEVAGPRTLPPRGKIKK
uniref:Ribosomal protein L34e superfamily protein n=1 Tax=Kalanchoe fedtschenkoi TaxID=63787 RepID=A0A7N0SW95_KALFE